MNYNGQELVPIAEPQIFDPPKDMLVWDKSYSIPKIKRVCAITMRDHSRVITIDSCYDYCAELPEEPKPKRATNLQLMEWLAKGNGMWKIRDTNTIRSYLPLSEKSLDKEVKNYIVIRPFGTNEWVETTLENMGME